MNRDLKASFMNRKGKNSCDDVDIPNKKIF